jgi:MFS transporter, DHA2 family, metal-tetracycline-proton antiporter
MTEQTIPVSKIDGSSTIKETKIILVWSFTVWLVVMNTTMFNVALPSVLHQLSLTSSTASWIVSGYSIVFAISTLTYSRLSDYLPISKLLLIGLLILGISSLIGLFSEHFYVLLISRIFQAAGAGAVPGLAMVLAGRYIPISRRGKAMAFISSAASLGFGLGPVIGGAITQYLGWNYLFAIPMFVLLLIPTFNKLLPKEEVKRVDFDTKGAIYTGLTVTGYLIFLSTFSYLAIFFSVFMTFLVRWHLSKAESPFIQPVLLKNRSFLQLLFIGFSAFIIHFSTLFLMPIMLTSVFNKEPAEVGMMIFPGAILSAFTAQLIGRLIDRYGNSPLIRFGQFLLLTALALFVLIGLKSPYAILFTYMFMSVGFSTLTASVSNEVTRLLPKNQIGAGLGLAQLIQFFGGAFGVTLTGISLTLQNGNSVQSLYQMIFIGLTIMIITSIVTFAYYVRSAKEL